MKKLFSKFSIIILLYLFFALRLHAGELILPEIAQQGSTVSLIYKPSKENSDSKSTLIAYCYASSQVKPTAYQAAISDKGEARIAIPMDAVYVMFKVVNGKTVDDNGQQFWSLFVVDTDNKVKEYAYFRAAISYLGQLPDNCKRGVSSAKSDEMLSQELRLYPDNVPAKAGKAILSYDNKKLTKIEFDKSIRSIFATVKDWSKEEVVRSAWRSFNAIGDKMKADSIANAFVKKHPTSELAEDYELDVLQRLNDQRQVVDLGMRYILNFPYSKEMPMLAQGLAPVAASLSILDSLIERYSKEKHRNPFVISMFAFIQVDADSTKIPSAIVYLTKERDALIQSGIQYFKPRWMSDVEWLDKEESMMTQITATRGFIYERNNQKMQAINDLEYVVTQYPLSCHEVIYDKLISLLYEDKKQWNKAFIWSGKAIELSRANDNIKKINQETFAPSAQYTTYDDYRKVLDKASAMTRRRSLKNQMLQQSMPKGTLLNQEGKSIEISSLLGKTLIIDFWATWCGPCRASFPAMQKLYDKYKNNDKVEFLIVNCWERSDDKKKTVDEFMTKNKYTFPVYFDENDTFAKSLGVTGIPAKFFVSPSGIIQFKESGFQGEAKFIEEGIDKIELLQSDIQ